MNDGAGAETFGDKGPVLGVFRDGDKGPVLGVFKDGDKGALTLEKGLGPVRLLLTYRIKKN